MASRFDPSAFIEAEESQAVATLASVATIAVPAPASPKTTEICGSAAAAGPTVATIATLAAPHAENLPFDREVRAFVDRPCPAGVSPEKWDELTAEVWDVHHHWAAKAVALGWTSIDLYGCNPNPLARRVDRNGLVAGIVGLLSPVRLVKITAEYAELASGAVRPMRFRPPPAPGAVHLWEAYSMATGP